MEQTLFERSDVPCKKLIAATLDSKSVPIKICPYIINDDGTVNVHLRTCTEIYLDECLQEWLRLVIGRLSQRQVEGEITPEDVTIIVIIRKCDEEDTQWLQQQETKINQI